jgi:long-chain acyl-CoA synthetase
VPKIVEFREDLPRTLIGKVLRRALREEQPPAVGDQQTA